MKVIIDRDNNKIVVSTKKSRSVKNTLSLNEFIVLMKAARSYTIEDNNITITYKNESSKVFAIISHCKNVKLPKRKIEQLKIEDIKPPKVSKGYVSSVEGTAKLVRMPKSGIIKIVRRKNSNDIKNYANSICINDYDKNRFFSDSRSSNSYYYHGGYAIWEENDPALYEGWSRYIDAVYLNNMPESMKKLTLKGNEI